MASAFNSDSSLNSGLSPVSELDNSNLTSEVDLLGAFEPEPTSEELSEITPQSDTPQEPSTSTNFDQLDENLPTEELSEITPQSDTPQEPSISNNFDQRDENLPIDLPFENFLQDGFIEELKSLYFYKYPEISSIKTIRGNEISNEHLQAYLNVEKDKEAMKSLFHGWEIYEFDPQEVRCFGDPDGFFTEKGSSYSRWNAWSTPKMRAKIASNGLGYQVITNYKRSNGRNDKAKGVGDNTFRVMVRKVENAEGTLLFLDGGGGCIAAHDDPRPNVSDLGGGFWSFFGTSSEYKPLGVQSCMREASIGGPFLHFLKKSLPALEDPIPYEEDEVVLVPQIKKKNIVYAPACDGSIFSGDRRISAMENQEGNEAIYYDGLRAIQATTNLMQKLFPKENNIMIHGGSAGGFGTFSGYASTRIRFPNAKIAIFNDSGLGILDPNSGNINPDGTPITTNEFFMSAWSLEKYFPENYKEKARKQPIYLYDYFLENDQLLKIALFTNIHDSVIRGYLGFQLNPVNEDESEKLSKEKFQEYLRETTNQIRENHSNRLIRFFVPGTKHTLLYWKDEAIKPQNKEIALNFVQWIQKFYNGETENIQDDPYNMIN